MLKRLLMSVGVLLSLGLNLDLHAKPKSNLSLADEAQIYQFANEIGVMIKEIPMEWRIIAEKYGVHELKSRLLNEVEDKSIDETKLAEDPDDEFFFY